MVAALRFRWWAEEDSAGVAPFAPFDGQSVPAWRQIMLTRPQFKFHFAFAFAFAYERFPTEVKPCGFYRDGAA